MTTPTPQLIELDDGTVGYFYSLHQLEEYYMLQVYSQPYEKVKDRWNPIDVKGVK